MPTWKMVCIGPGPGPKNVLAERDDGFRLVVPYAVWKHKLSKETEIAEYRNLIGIVQFDPDDAEVGSQKVRRFLLQPAGSAGGAVRVTLWPEFAGAKVGKGDSVHVSGKLDTKTVSGKTYVNLGAIELFVNGVRQEKASDEISNPVEEEDEDFDPGF